jgi:hypothetical protein
MTKLQTENRRPERGPLLTEVVEGNPLQIAGREVVPLVRLRGRMRRRASLRGDDVGGQGYGFIDIRPVALVDRRDGDEAYLRIPNGTVRAIGWRLLVALIVPWLAILLVQLSRQLDSGRSRDGAH